MDQSKREEKAFDFAADVTKQQLTLSTAVITLTITFSNQLLQGVPSGTRHILLMAWGAYVLSILAGLITLMMLTGTLGLSKSALREAGKKSEAISIYRVPVRIFAASQVVLFFVATSLTVLYGVSAARHWPTAQTVSPAQQTIGPRK